MTKKKILIATGGTGGHIFPALSLANNLIQKDYSVQLTTDKRGLKYIKDYKELSFIRLSSSPLIKKNILRFLQSLSIILSSIIKSFIILLFNRPSLIFGMGGYSSFPICFAASILRIKFIIYENNLVIGKANKYLEHFAEKLFVSYEDIEGISKKNKNKVILIGNIIREEIINSSNTNIDKSDFNKIKILVLGGSQAAKIFAEKLPQEFKKIKDKGGIIKVFQQCLPNQNEKLTQFYKKENIDFELFNFTKKIMNYYSKVNLAITRSGASVLGELLNTKTPFIAIPLPTAADNHQFKNAKFYESKGYGYLLEEKDISKKLYKLIDSFIKNKTMIQKIIFNQNQYSDKDVFKKINFNLEKIINEKN